LHSQRQLRDRLQHPHPIVHFEDLLAPVVQAPVVQQEAGATGGKILAMRRGQTLGNQR
jgi:hypothetical protein